MKNLIFCMILLFAASAFADEDQLKKEKMPSEDEVRSVMLSYINDKASRTDSFNINHPETGKALRLVFHDFYGEMAVHRGRFTVSGLFKEMNKEDSGIVLDFDIMKVREELLVLGIRFPQSSEPINQEQEKGNEQ